MTNKHLLNDELDKILEERKYTFSSLGTHVWEKRIAQRIFTHFNGKYIEDLKEEDFIEFFNRIRFKENGELLSAKYLKEIRRLLNLLIRKTMRKGYLTQNPIEDLTLPAGVQGQPLLDRLITEKDLNKLFSVLHENLRLKIIIGLLLLTGLRIGELLGLYKNDIDRKKGVLYIRRSTKLTYKEVNNEIICVGTQTGKTKTISSCRELPVDDSVFILLDEWEKHINTYPGMVNLREKKRTSHLVFVNYQGGIMKYNTIYKSLKSFLEKHNLEHCNVLFHNFRHCYATHHVDAGTDINVISKLLGHLHVSTTAKVYANVNLAPKQAAVKKHGRYISDKINIGDII